MWIECQQGSVKDTVRHSTVDVFVHMILSSFKSFYQLVHVCLMDIFPLLHLVILLYEKGGWQ